MFASCVFIHHRPVTHPPGHLAQEIYVYIAVSLYAHKRGSGAWVIKQAPLGRERAAAQQQQCGSLWTSIAYVAIAFAFVVVAIVVSGVLEITQRG